MARQDDPTRIYLKELLWAAAMINLIMVLVGVLAGVHLGRRRRELARSRWSPLATCGWE